MSFLLQHGQYPNNINRWHPIMGSESSGRHKEEELETVIYHTCKARNWNIFRGSSVNIDIALVQIKKYVIQRLDLRIGSMKASNKYRCLIIFLL